MLFDNWKVVMDTTPSPTRLLNKDPSARFHMFEENLLYVIVVIVKQKHWTPKQATRVAFVAANADCGVG